MKPARDDSLDVLIVGLGAMACLTGARLTRSGARTAVAGTWTAGLAAVREQGVIVEDPFAPPGTRPDQGSPAPVEVRVFDRRLPAPRTPFVLVLVKAHQTASVAPYVDKIRYNPGHLHHVERDKSISDKVSWLVAIARDTDTAIRIGVNCGSVAPAFLERFPGDQLEALVQSALYHCQLMEDLGFERFVVSLKDSDPAKVIEVNRSHLDADPPLALIQKRVAAVGEHVDYFQSQGCICILYEMPLDPSLRDLKVPGAVRQAMETRFPAHAYDWIVFDRSVHYETSDGIHLRKEGARQLTLEFLRQVDAIALAAR